MLLFMNKAKKRRHNIQDCKPLAPTPFLDSLVCFFFCPSACLSLFVQVCGYQACAAEGRESHVGMPSKIASLSPLHLIFIQWCAPARISCASACECV